MFLVKMKICCSSIIFTINNNITNTISFIINNISSIINCVKLKRRATSQPLANTNKSSTNITKKKRIKFAKDSYKDRNPAGMLL